MNKSNLVRILIKGGILSPGYMLKIAKIARKSGNESVYFGSRQDILFMINSGDIEEVRNELSNKDFKIILENLKQENEQNITSSYLAYDILPSTSWLSEGTYISILEDFHYLPKLKINIVDPVQNLVPIYFGELNFIASERENHWFLYINLSRVNIKIQWPGLVYSKDIPTLSKDIETLIYTNGTNIKAGSLVSEIEAGNKYYFYPVDSTPKYPTGFFSDYEGINPMLNGGKYWAGFYWRNNKYDIRFLEAISGLCLRTNLSTLCITPWKTFLVKGIHKEDLIRWQQLIGQYGINMRHSSFDLNWHLPLVSESSYKLKNYIAGRFNKIDVRTYGLTFAISSSVEAMFTSIVIVRKPMFKIFSGVFNLWKYKIFYARNFDLTSHEYVPFTYFISKRDLVENLVELCRRYYLQLNIPKSEKKMRVVHELKEKQTVFHCPDCLTVYDEQIGDERAGILVGTAYGNLPESYGCQVCGTSKSYFIRSVKEGLEVE